MKNFIFLAGLLGGLFITACSKPNAEDVLRKSYEQCQSIESGYYEMTRYMKYMSDKDTSSNFFSCHFNKLPDDSTYSFAFHYQKFNDGKYSRSVLYTGDDFVNYSTKDSSGEIMSKIRWAKDIKAYSHNYKFYSPFTNKDSYPLPQDSIFIDNKHVFEFIGEETINNIACYHVKMNILQEYDSTEMMQRIRAENNYWISKKDYLPIQYTIAYDLVMNGDTMCQFEKNVLSKHVVNPMKVESQLSLSSIPSYINLKDYVNYKIPELLPKDTVAPEWSLVSLNDKTVKLSDFKGKIVLVDFFYKSC
jgi:outer membrane lipoprotein-sorting protein